MTTTEQPTAELLDRGYRVLLQELGPSGFARFMQHFRPGRGDYTAERQAWLPQSVEEIFNHMDGPSKTASPIPNQHD